MAEVLPPALVAESERYPWWPEAWGAIDGRSRAAYTRWVAAGGSRAERRARHVSRRLWNRRPWAGPVRRRLQALWDLVEQDQSLTSTDATLAAPGWLP